VVLSPWRPWPRGLAIDKLAVYEVPYNMADDWPQRWREYAEQLEAALAEAVAVTR
jgi:hypothetical protein